MLDRAFRDAFRNFSTLFLVVAIATIPIHLAYAFAFRNVIATHEIHPQIREFPNYRQVRSVGPKQLTHSTIAFWALTGLEVIVVLPLAVKATRRVLNVEEEGGVATAPDAWRNALHKTGHRRFAPASLPSVAIAVIAAFVLVALIETALLSAAELIGARNNWATVGTVQGVARATALPFVLATIARARIAKERPHGTPKLY